MRRSRVVLVAVLTFAQIVLQLPSYAAPALLPPLAAAATLFTVTSLADTDVCDESTCTLRGAITQANATPNGGGLPDLVAFNIDGAGPYVIAPATALPPITEALVIDGR